MRRYSSTGRPEEVLRVLPDRLELLLADPPALVRERPGRVDPQHREHAHHHVHVHVLIRFADSPAHLGAYRRSHQLSLSLGVDVRVAVGHPVGDGERCAR